ncbi:hypothetical protein QR680_018440 [Steinernema hermaphroditum]|uniref:Uncharacterized protein n=1 Tax=Steinernema hermaphroditum TaxID=289476 RepID=A0AA39HKA4_9BILA|nr:hypothetical protein QR680_018440 [Steinernema hermaphroditum]
MSCFAECYDLSTIDVDISERGLRQKQPVPLNTLNRQTTPNHNSPPAQTTNEHLEKLTAAVYRLERHLFDISLSMHALTINVRDMQLDRPSPSPPLEEL